MTLQDWLYSYTANGDLKLAYADDDPPPPVSRRGDSTDGSSVWTWTRPTTEWRALCERFVAAPLPGRWAR